MMRKRRPPITTKKTQGRPQRGEPQRDPSFWLYGSHAVRAALANPRRVCLHFCYHGRNKTTEHLTMLAEQRGVQKIESVTLTHLARLLVHQAVHQGVALRVLPLHPLDWRQASQQQGRRLFVLLEQIQDPQNVGALLRSCWLFGVDGVFITKYHTARNSGVLAKAASGACDYVPLYTITNVHQTLRALQGFGYMLIGFDARASVSLPAYRFGSRNVMIFGQEGRGMRALTRNSCDVVLKIPHKTEESLNVSVSLGIALYVLSQT